MKTLEELAPTERAEIHSVTGTGSISRRLAELGFVKGQPVQVVRLAPLGDPLQVRIRGFDLALRRQEAARVVVVQENDKD